jgi:isochorismate hydrolase
MQVVNVVNFVKSLTDACAQSNACLFAALDPKAVEKQQRALLSRIFDKTIG